MEKDEFVLKSKEADHAKEGVIEMITTGFQAWISLMDHIPTFGDKRKKEVSKLTEVLSEKKEMFRRYAISFDEDSYSDVLMGLSDEVKKTEKLLEQKWIIYAKELKE